MKGYTPLYAALMGLWIVSVSAPALATACVDYNARIDLETKIGNNRNIGEASAFLPVACTPDRLLFSDIRFRADNKSNREANMGFGARLMRETGIAGGYIYFDRKKSGESDKFYNQITPGAEWLALNWETRANVYIPLNGKKTINQNIYTSAPYLIDRGIFVDTNSATLKESPFYGADVEAGFKVINDNLWIYGGGYSFHASDMPSITGARARARYAFNDHLSLNAEGQYDDERGRQGWIGARLSIPFGAVNAAQNALQNRMTASPIRDIDIVTSQKVDYKLIKSDPVDNPQSGTAQRVIYVDNRATAGGDGSLASPFNTLSEAQNNLEDYDIVYIYHGNGTSSGMDQGFEIDKDHVRIIGEGSAFTFNGYPLKAAGKKPIITNIIPSSSSVIGSGIQTRDKNISISGLSIQSTTGNGLRIDLTDNANFYDLISIDNVDILDSGRHGLYISMNNGISVDTIFMRDVHLTGTNGSNSNAIVVAEGGAIIDKIDIAGFRSVTSPIEGLNIRAWTGSTINDIQIRDSFFDANNRNGLYLDARNGSNIHRAEIDNIVISNAVQSGLLIGTMSNGIMDNVTIRNSDFIGLNREGIRLDKDSVGIFNIDLSGNNRIFGNRTSDLRLDLDGGTVQATENWWGQGTGPQAGQIIDDGGTHTGTADTSDWLLTDPRP